MELLYRINNMNTQGQNLAPTLNLQQLKENIDALQKGGLASDKIQSYVDNYQKAADGSYTLKTATPAQPQNIPPNAADVFNAPGLMKTGADVVTGVAKGAADLPREAAALGTSDMVQNAISSQHPLIKAFTDNVLSPVLKKILSSEQLKSVHDTLGQVQGGLQAGTEQTNFTKPTNNAQKVGFSAEKVGEFFVPGGALAEAGKGLEAATAASKLPSIAKAAINLGGKAALEGGAAASVTALQSGGDAEATKDAGLISAAFPLASKLLSSSLGKVPESAWSSILKRTSTQVAKNPNLPEQASQTGLTALSKEGLAKKAGSMIQGIETQLDDILSNSKGSVNTSDVVKHLDALKESYANIPGESHAVDVVENVKNEMLAKGEKMSAQDANQLKRDIYGVISKSYGKGLMEIPAKQEAQKTLARGLKEEIAKVEPKVIPLNQQQGVYIQIKKAIDRQLTLGEGKGVNLIPGVHLGMYDLMTGLGGLVGGGLHGGAVGAARTSAALIAAKKATESTFVLSNIAKVGQYFNELSPTKKVMFYNGLKGLVSQGLQAK